MYLRRYKSEDCREITNLFYNTVHSVNRADYTEKEVAAWADGNIDTKVWNKSFLSHYTIVAVKNDIIIGFGDITDDGYLDRLYVHKDYQRQKVATAICNELEAHIEGSITTHASITAKPFFEKRGYQVVRQQQIERNGILLTNFRMINNRTSSSWQAERQM